MLDPSQGLSSGSSGVSARRQLALDRIQQLVSDSQARAAQSWRNYHVAQGLTVGLAAITPCLIVLAKENPGNGVLNWLQLFFPAIAAIAAGVTHLYRWREDGVRFTGLAESIRSQLWRYQTRSGEFGGALSDEQALDRLVVQVDNLNLQSVARWSSLQLADASSASAPGSHPARALADQGS